MPAAVVETRGLRKRYGPTLAVADLSLSLRPGEVFGFLGPNGAGKTTSLKMLLGLVEPSAGTGRVLGAPLGDRLARARVGFLPEHFRFQEWLTGRELLRFHGRLFGLGGRPLEARIEELLARVHLLEAAGRKLREYSKGMSQRIGLAQALLNRPELVFLDEPTSGLDPLGRLLVRDVIRELRAGGTAVFLNSHLLGEVEATCDRVAFLKEGRTVRELELGEGGGELEVELRLAGADAATLAGLESLGSRLDGASADLAAGLDRSSAAAPPASTGPSAVPNRAESPTLVRLRVASEERLPEIAAYLVGRGVRLYGLRAGRPSLERVFLEIMGDDGRPG